MAKFWVEFGHFLKKFLAASGPNRQKYISFRCFLDEINFQFLTFYFFSNFSSWNSSKQFLLKQKVTNLLDAESWEASSLRPFFPFNWKISGTIETKQNCWGSKFCDKKSIVKLKNNWWLQRREKLFFFALFKIFFLFFHALHSFLVIFSA